MNVRLELFLFGIALLLSSINSAQNYSTGLLLDDQYFENDAESVPLTRGDYQNLPISHSLKFFSPTPGDQGSYGTCTGWSSAYAGRTILEAMRNNWSKEKVDTNAFSPSYIYNQIRMSDDCFGAASIIDALDILKDQGGLKIRDFAYDCDLEVTEEDKGNARNHTIVEYREVADRYTVDKTLMVKKSLSENKPVVIAMNCPNSFFTANEVWTPRITDYKQWSVGHAMCVIGYDDEKFGGAFEIINSWGTKWGKDGFTWMRYKDFQFFCLFAFELIDKAIYEWDQWDLSGSIKFIESNNEPMRTIQENRFLEFEQPYVSGTLFELFVSNNQPAYVVIQC